MKCKKCKREIPDESIFCMICGEKIIRGRGKAKKDTVSVPKPIERAPGRWYIYLAKEHTTVIEDSAALCTAKAQAVRAGFIEQQKRTAGTLRNVVKSYIDQRANSTRKRAISPSTLRGYNKILELRFKNYMDKDVNRINYQEMVDAELDAGLSPKSVKNAWCLVNASLKAAGVEFKAPTIPEISVPEMPWLDYDQIKVFCEAIYGKPYEIPALLMLHSLRRSEAIAITPGSIQFNTKKQRYEIHVCSAAVVDEHNKLIVKAEGKSRAAARDVPVMMPRLLELIEAYGGDADKPFYQSHFSRLYENINYICRMARLPEVGCHGLRRSFVSLCHHLGVPELECASLGGWDDLQTMHKHYLKLSDKDLDVAVDAITEFYQKP